MNYKYRQFSRDYAWWMRRADNDEQTSFDEIEDVKGSP